MPDKSLIDFLSLLFAGVAVAISIILYVKTKEQVDNAKRALKDNTLLSLFAGFDQANQAVIDNPKLLVTVHGLDEDDIDLENIAYLAILIDAFHHYWSKEYDEDYEKVLTLPSSFINRIVEVEDNYPRWIKLRSINYGRYDKQFVQVMDKIFKEGREHLSPRNIYNDDGDLIKIIYTYKDGKESEHITFIGAARLVKNEYGPLEDKKSSLYGNG